MDKEQNSEFNSMFWLKSRLPNIVKKLDIKIKYIL